VGANIGVTLLVFAAGWLVLLASPWRNSWLLGLVRFAANCEARANCGSEGGIPWH